MNVERTIYMKGKIKTKESIHLLTKISGLPRAVILIAENPVPPVEPVNWTFANKYTFKPKLNGTNSYWVLDI